MAKRSLLSEQPSYKSQQHNVVGVQHGSFNREGELICRWGF